MIASTQGHPGPVHLCPPPRGTHSEVSLDSKQAAFPRGHLGPMSFLFRKKVKNHRQNPGGVLANHGPQPWTACCLCPHLVPRPLLWVSEAQGSPLLGKPSEGGRWLSQCEPSERLPWHHRAQAAVRSATRSLTHLLIHPVYLAPTCSRHWGQDTRLGKNPSGRGFPEPKIPPHKRKVTAQTRAGVGGEAGE